MPKILLSQMKERCTSKCLSEEWQEHITKWLSIYSFYEIFLCVKWLLIYEDEDIIEVEPFYFANHKKDYYTHDIRKHYTKSKYVYPYFRRFKYNN